MRSGSSFTRKVGPVRNAMLSQSSAMPSDLEYTPVFQVRTGLVDDSIHQVGPGLAGGAVPKYANAFNCKQHSSMCDTKIPCAYENQATGEVKPPSHICTSWISIRMRMSSPIKRAHSRPCRKTATSNDVSVGFFPPCDLCPAGGARRRPQPHRRWRRGSRRQKILIREPSMAN